MKPVRLRHRWVNELDQLGACLLVRHAKDRRAADAEI